MLNLFNTRKKISQI